MARHRWMLALILIYLSILTSVITAFRVRDLPKTSHESAKKDHKCEDCDVRAGYKLHGIKIESDQHSYDDVKKIVQGKPHSTNQNTPGPKSSHKYDVKSDEDGYNDLDSDLSEIETGFRREYPKISKVQLKSVSSKKEWSLDDDDDGEVEDDDETTDDDDNFSGVVKYPKIMNFKTKVDPKLQQLVSKSKNIDINYKYKYNDDDDEDDNDSDSDSKENVNNDNKSVENKPKITDIKKKTDDKQNKIKLEVKIKAKGVQKSTFDKNQDNDDGDDIDENSKTISSAESKSSIIDTKDKIVIKSKQIITESKDKKIQSSGSRKDSDVVDVTKNKLSNAEMKNKPDATTQIKTKSDVELKQRTTETKAKAMGKATLKEKLDNDSDNDDKATDEKNEVPIKNSNKTMPKTLSERKFTSQIPFTNDLKDQDQTRKKLSEKHDDKIKDKKVDIKPQSTDKKSKKSEIDTKDFDSLKISKKADVQEAMKISGKDNAKSVMPGLSTTIKEEKKVLKTLQEKPIAEHIQPTVDDVKSLQEKDGKGHENIKIVGKKIVAEPNKNEGKHVDTFKIVGSKKETNVDLGNKHSAKSHKHLNKQQDKISKEKLFDSQEVLTKSESNLRHVTDALHRRNLLKSEFEDFYAFFPTFAPNFSRIHNSECRRHGQIVLRQLRGTKLWALNMLDATAKIPSGILQGNGIQLGDFDQCLGSRARVQLETGSVVKVQGKYCLARIDVKAEHPELETPVHLAQAKNLIRSRIDDPGHFVPRFSTLSWGICIPAACNPEDVETVLRDAVKHYQHTSGVAIRVKVDEQDCHTEQGADWWEDWLELPTLLTLSFYGIIILLVLVATIQDFIARRKSDEVQDTDEANEKAECDQKETKKQNKEKVDASEQLDGFVSAFSLYRTISKLVAPGTSDEIACIHGVRGIATIALLVAHKFMPVAVMPYTNRLNITETVSSPLWSWCRAGWIFTDCFLLLSGALTAHRICTDKDAAAPKRLFSRYLRLTPALLAVVLFYAYIWDHISVGPMWGTFVTKNAQVCQNGWWWNMLYVQNYFGFEEMCAPQTHQLALDMQLTILGGIIVWAIQVKQGLSGLLLPTIHIIAAYSRYTTVRDHRLTLLAYHGVSVSQLYRTARLSYTSTLHRSTPYLVGLSLGLALKTPRRYGMFVLALGWLVSSLLWGLVWWAGFDSGSTQYRYSVTFAAQYAALAPIASAIAIAWVIFAVNNGSSGLLSRILCCRPLVFISRLSYALYLCQFIVFITNIATVKTSSEFTLMSLFDIKEIWEIFISSTIVTLTFVIPMQSLHKIFTFSSKTPTSESSKEFETKELNNVQKDEGKDTLLKRPRQIFVAHREVLEEIPEIEVEYEMQRHKNERLDEILEHEEEMEEEESHNHFDDDLEIIEEEQDGDEEIWADRGYEQRPYSREDVRQEDLDEWEWTANGRNGDQQHRSMR